MAVNRISFEQGPIRPPNEAGSLLIRLTRNCPWNRCLFCPVYKGAKFSRRSVEEIKRDIDAIAAAVEAVRVAACRAGVTGRITREILSAFHAGSPELFSVAWWLYRGEGTVFLQDADSLVLPVADLVEILRYLRRKVPGINRITTYARSRTLLRKSVQELIQLKEAGLSRVHVGLESGCDAVLEFMQKGVTGEQHIEAARRVKEAGLALSEYIILGLGGRAMWREHALDTARVLREIDPDYIRVRTLAVPPAAPLYRKWEQGEFTVAADEEILQEEALLLEHLQGLTGRFYSDHILNLLEEVAGKLPEDLDKMKGVIDRYFSWPETERERFRLGRRMGVYRTLEDAGNPVLAGRVERHYRQLAEKGIAVDDYIRQLMLGYL